MTLVSLHGLRFDGRIDRWYLHIRGEFDRGWRQVFADDPTLRGLIVERATAEERKRLRANGYAIRGL